MPPIYSRSHIPGDWWLDSNAMTPTTRSILDSQSVKVCNKDQHERWLGPTLSIILLWLSWACWEISQSTKWSICRSIFIVDLNGLWSLLTWLFPCPGPGKLTFCPPALWSCWHRSPSCTWEPPRCCAWSWWRSFSLSSWNKTQCHPGLSQLTE